MAVASQLVVQNNFELNLILQDWLMEDLVDDPVIGPKGIFPIDVTEFAEIQWDQLDNAYGLTALRGIEGQPGRVQMLGKGTYKMLPGYYGDEATITEDEMTTWRKPGSYNMPWDIEDLVSIREKQLLVNAMQRIKQVVWALISNGTFSVSSPDGRLTHSDTFPIQTAATVHPWSAQSTSTPLADDRSIQLLHRGHSVKFDASSQQWMNRKTFNYMISNTNSADLGGRRGAGLSTIEGVKDLNMLLAKDDLPAIVIYDEGYATTANPNNSGSSGFTPFIPDNQVVVFGRRPGNAPIGHARFTRNASLLSIRGKEAESLQDSPYAGFAIKLIDRGETQSVGRSLDLGLGFNWGPTIEYPSAVVSLNAGAGS